MIVFFLTLTEHHRAGTFPTELLPEIADLGAFGASIEGYGCAGLNNVSYGLVPPELERGDSGLRSLCSVRVTGDVSNPYLRQRRATQSGFLS